tara:strand:- start:148 stop:363 length:216 start_codon:yes stop_codon:yes gene_type:complete
MSSTLLERISETHTMGLIQSTYEEPYSVQLSDENFLVYIEACEEYGVDEQLTQEELLRYRELIYESGQVWN